MYQLVIEEVTPMNISQFREGNLGRLASQDAGMPVYLRAVRRPDSGGGGGGRPLEVIRVQWWQRSSEALNRLFDMDPPSPKRMKLETQAVVTSSDVRPTLQSL